MTTKKNTSEQLSESNMPRPEPTPREWVFADIAKLVDARMPLPMTLNLFARGACHLRLDENDRAGVDVWAAELGLPVPSLELPVFDRPDETRRWASYRAQGAHPLWVGRTVDVWCSVELDVDASAHWDGLLLGSVELTAVSS